MEVGTIDDHARRTTAPTLPGAPVAVSADRTPSANHLGSGAELLVHPGDPFGFVAGPLDAAGVIPDAWAAFVVAEDELADGEREIVPDGARLAAERSAEWGDWPTGWSLRPDDAGTADPVDPIDPAGAPAAGDAATDHIAADVVIVVGAEPDGTARVVSISSPTIGGTPSYSLWATRSRSMTVEAPDLARAG